MKFKVWDFEKEEFVDDKKLGRFWINPEGDLTRDFKIKYVSEARYTAVIFTGLTDKNGVEYFIGSIAKDKHGNIHLIKWFKGRFETDLLKNRFTNCSRLLDRSHSDWEIIGNKFENPELLTS